MKKIKQQDEVRNVLNKFGSSLQRDLYGWQGWYGIHVYPKPQATQKIDVGEQENIAETLITLNPGLDGTILTLDDTSLFILYRDEQPIEPFTLIRELNQNLPGYLPILQCRHYSMREEHSEVLNLISRYVRSIGFRKTPTPSLQKNLLESNVSDLASWKYAAQLRNERTSPCILVIDDDPVTRRIIRNALGADYTVLMAKDAREGIRKHLSLAPDIIFLDIGLPEHDGFSVLSHIRQYDMRCKIIMFTGHTYLEQRMHAMTNGAEGFIAKPFKRENFDHYIDAWTNKQQRIHMW